MKKDLIFFYTRFKALVIDIFMIYTPILYITTYAILGGKENFQNNQWAILICFLIYAFIDSLFCALAQQTPGMRAQDLILQNKNAKKANFLLCFLRFLLCFLSFALIFGFIFPFLRKDRKSFHDLICHTQLIKKSSQNNSNPHHFKQN